MAVLASFKYWSCCWYASSKLRLSCYGHHIFLGNYIETPSWLNRKTFRGSRPLWPMHILYSLIVYVVLTNGKNISIFYTYKNLFISWLYDYTYTCTYVVLSKVLPYVLTENIIIMCRMFFLCLSSCLARRGLLRFLVHVRHLVLDPLRAHRLIWQLIYQKYKYLQYFIHVQYVYNYCIFEDRYSTIVRKYLRTFVFSTVRVHVRVHVRVLYNLLHVGLQYVYCTCTVHIDKVSKFF